MQVNSPSFIESVLNCIEKDVVPLTEKAVQDGNKVFGAAVLKKEDMSLVVAGTNMEMEWPLLHGEVSCLRNLQKLESRPDNKSCVFVCTHEPCSLCLSAITWSGFDNFVYLFGYQATKDTFNIPHDLQIMDSVFDCKDGSYNRENRYWKASGISDLIASLPDGEEKQKLTQQVERLGAKYNELSEVYQASKSDGSTIPLS